MAVTIQSGPIIISGNTNATQNSEPDQGPSLTFQGSGLLDPRYMGAVGAAPGTKIFGLYANSYVVSTDAVPVILSVSRVAAAAATVAATPMALVTAQAAGVSPLVPVLPFGAGASASNLVNALALDFGFCVGNVTSASPTLTLPAGAWRYFTKGQRLLVAGAGASAGNLFTTVLNTPVPGATTITMADNALTSTNGVQVGAAHPTLNCAWPFINAGTISLFDPTQGVARAVSITGPSGSTAQNFVVRGYDVYGQAMTESIPFAGGAATTNGKKAFKYIASVTPAATDVGHTMSVGTTDILGFNFRSDYWEYVDVFVAGAFVSVNTGWVVTDVTTPATTTTGDVRGTYALQTASNGDGTVTNWAAARRVAMFSSLPIFNSINANNLNYSTMFGNTQV
jgi:hypothetical protein